MSKSTLPYLIPMIQHELTRMKAVMQVHKALVEPFFDSSVETDRYVDIAVEVISNALEKGDIKIPLHALREEIKQQYLLSSTRELTVKAVNANPFSQPEEAVTNSVNCSTSTVSMLAEASSSKDLSKIPLFMLKPPTATETEAN